MAVATASSPKISPQALVLSGGQAGRFGLALAPAQEASQAGAQFQQSVVVLVRGVGWHWADSRASPVSPCAPTARLSDS
jgi:hypothetical protein